MTDSMKNPLDAILDAIREVVRNEINAAFAKQRPEKLLINTAEAAYLLDVPESWIASKARTDPENFPHIKKGHYRHFSRADLDKIIANMERAKNGTDG